MAPRTGPFDEHAAMYDRWFDSHEHAYASELAAIRAVLPRFTHAVEVGVGTGRFAAALGIGLGVEPSAAMAGHASARGIRVLAGTAERLPLDDASVDLVLMVTVICFVDDLAAALQEAMRVLVGGGHVVIAFLDRGTALGSRYDDQKSQDPFFAEARFRSADELLAELRRTGFVDAVTVQTIFAPPAEMAAPAEVRPGHGSGLFAVVRAGKPVSAGARHAGA